MHYLLPKILGDVRKYSKISCTTYVLTWVISFSRMFHNWAILKKNCQLRSYSAKFPTDWTYNFQSITEIVIKENEFMVSLGLYFCTLTYIGWSLDFKFKEIKGNKEWKSISFHFFFFGLYSTCIKTSFSKSDLTY